MPVYSTCFECGNRIQVSPYGEPTPGKKYLDICMDCRESKDIPEFNLWLDEDGVVLDSGEDWAVVDMAEAQEERAKEMREELRQSDNPVLDPDDYPDPEYGKNLEIYLNDEDDQQALEEAREEARSRLN